MAAFYNPNRADDLPINNILFNLIILLKTKSKYIQIKSSKNASISIIVC